MLSTAAALQAFLALPDASDNNLLSRYLDTVTAIFERYCSRKFQFTAGAVFGFRASDMEIVVDRYPILQVTDFQTRDNASSPWVSQMPGVDFEVELDAGIVRLLDAPFGAQNQLAQAIFDGGYLMPGDLLVVGATALPTELETAALEQAAFLYHHRHTIRTADLAGRHESANANKVDLLETVKLSLDPYRRFRL